MRNKLFVSYSHSDTEWLQKLQPYLMGLESNGAINLWIDKSQIKAGDQWRAEIEAALATSKAALLLVSQDFLVSNFINKVELPSLLAAAHQSGVRILWVPLRPSLVERSVLAKYQAAWPPNKPIAGLPKAKQEEAWVKICNAITEAAQLDLARKDPIGHAATIHLGFKAEAVASRSTVNPWREQAKSSQTGVNMAAKFQIFLGQDRQYYFRLLANQGERILHSEGYTSKLGAQNGIAAVKTAAPHDGQYDRYTSPTIYFTLKVVGNNQVIGVSETYSSVAAREIGIASVKSNAPGAWVEDLTD